MPVEGFDAVDLDVAGFAKVEDLSGADGLVLVTIGVSLEENGWFVVAAFQDDLVFGFVVRDGLAAAPELIGLDDTAAAGEHFLLSAAFLTAAEHVELVAAKVQ